MDLPENLEPAAAWTKIRAELRRSLSESAYEIWIAPLEARSFDGSILVLAAPPTTRAWLAKRFGRHLERATEAVLGGAVRVTLEHDGGLAAGAPRPDRPTLSLNPRYSFEQFIIGESNRLAHAAALAVAELPGQAYNPLFLYAPPGLGKTHLLHAIGNYITAFGAGTRVRYTTAETFTNDFIHALGNRSLERFKQAYRDSDVLLIDDVQFLASKARTEEEFFHTFNALYESGRQLVVTCDRLPRALAGVEQRLRERFEAGLVADIRPPDLHTRVAILRKRAMLDQIALDDATVLDLIAERVTDNIRTLEGALIRIVAYHSLTSQPIDAKLASTVLDTMYPSLKPSLSIPAVKSAVAAYYGLEISDLTSSARASRVAWPRQVAISLARELTGASLQAIGDAFGGRNHATIIHACKRVSERTADDPQASHDLTELKAAIDPVDRTDRSG